MGNNARFDQPEMALAAYETWMALEQCEKYRLIRKERSDEITAALSGVILPGEEQWDMRRVTAWLQGYTGGEYAG